MSWHWIQQHKVYIRYWYFVGRPIFCSLLYKIYWKSVGTLIWPVNLRFFANIARILFLFTFTSCNIFYGIRSSLIFHETHFSCLLILSRYCTQNRRMLVCLHNWIRIIKKSSISDPYSFDHIIVAYSSSSAACRHPVPASKASSVPLPRSRSLNLASWCFRRALQHTLWWARRRCTTGGQGLSKSLAVARRPLVKRKVLTKTSPPPVPRPVWWHSATLLFCWAAN